MKRLKRWLRRPWARGGWGKARCPPALMAPSRPRPVRAPAGRRRGRALRRRNAGGRGEFGAFAPGTALTGSPGAARAGAGDLITTAVLMGSYGVRGGGRFSGFSPFGKQKCTARREAGGKEKPNKSVCWWRLIAYFPLSQQMWGPALEPLWAGRIAPGPGSRALLPFFAQAQGELQGPGPCHTRRLERHSGIRVSLTYPWVLGGGTRLLVVFHGFALLSQTLTLLSASLQAVVTGILPVCQHTSSRTALHWAGFFSYPKLLIGWGIISPFPLIACRKAQVWVCFVFLLWDANCLRMGSRRTIS